MSNPSSDTYDVIIIGAGLSGLAAGIRLSQFFKKVLILESHNIAGGLNSYYERGQPKQLFSSGLHTITNATVTGRKWGLGLIARNLGIKPEEFEIYAPTCTSRISIPEKSVRFSNDNNFLMEEIRMQFPRHIDEFVSFQEKLIKLSANQEAAKESAANFVSANISDPKLVELIILPIFTYTGYAEDDIDLMTFARLYRSLFIDGCGSPIDMKQFLFKLISLFEENGGEICFKSKVKEIEHSDGVASGLRLKDGKHLSAKFILSSAGLQETGELAKKSWGNPGQISLFQLAVSYDSKLTEIGVNDSVHFLSRRTPLVWHFREESDCFNIVTFSAQDSYEFASKKHQLKVSCFDHISNWESLDRRTYNEKKAERVSALFDIAREVYPGIAGIKPTVIDSFSPVTIRKYTGHSNGTLYGGSEKSFDGLTPLKNLYIIGNDQGGIGIMGALTSGILISNYNILI